MRLPFARPREKQARPATLREEVRTAVELMQRLGIKDLHDVSTSGIGSSGVRVKFLNTQDAGTFHARLSGPELSKRLAASVHGSSVTFMPRKPTGFFGGIRANSIVSHLLKELEKKHGRTATPM